MKRYIFFLAALLSLPTAIAQEADNDGSSLKNRTQQLINAALKGVEIEIRGGYNIGGTTPIPLPAEIRSINSYSPTAGFSIECNVSKWFGDKKQWAVITGIKLENKNMETDATVKNYGMEILNEGALVAGRWTGGVRTSVRNSFMTFPILGAYKVHPRTSLKFGVFLSYLMEGKFNGYVYDGYIRNGDPTGEKTSFADGATATYDFSDRLRKFQWGLQIGADWKAFKHLKVYGDLSWGLNDAFPDDFQTITFSMYPIYLNVGVGYLF